MCPFDNGGSSLAVDGVILNRYALGFTGAPLVANTGIAAANVQTVVDSINSPAWGLNITGNPAMSSVDAAIISRKRAGFSGAALTNGLALSGSRNTPQAVQSFLLAGCPGTAWIQGGNAFGAPGVVGTLDAQPMKVVSGVAAVSLELASGSGVRITDTAPAAPGSVNVVNGSVSNLASPGVRGATIAGGGMNYPSSGQTAWGDFGNRVSGYAATRKIRRAVGRS